MGGEGIEMVKRVSTNTEKKRLSDVVSEINLDEVREALKRVQDSAKAQVLTEDIILNEIVVLEGILRALGIPKSDWGLLAWDVDPFSGGRYGCECVTTCTKSTSFAVQYTGSGWDVYDIKRKWLRSPSRRYLFLSGDHSAGLKRVGSRILKSFNNLSEMADKLNQLLGGQDDSSKN